MAELTNHPTYFLRQALLESNGTPPKLETDNTYNLGGRKFAKDTETCLKRILGQKEVYYTIHDIVFFLTYSKNQAEYRKNAAIAKVTTITATDQNHVKDYFNGVSENCPVIDQVKLQQQIKENTKGAASSSSSSSSTSSSSSSSSAVQENSGKRGFADISSESSTKLTDAAPLAGGGAASEKGIYSQERRNLCSLIGAPSHDRNSILRTPGSDYSSIIKGFNEHVLKHPSSSSSAEASGDPKRPRSESESKVPSSSQKSSSTSTSSSSSQGEVSGTPIIIVPNAPSSVINMLNAVEFLQDAKFVSATEKRSAGAVSEKEKTFYRKTSSGSSIKYKVIDSPQLLKKEDWGRVVAVFVLGEAWQFKTWVHNKPAELFQKVLGIHLQIEGQIVPPDISTWNCKVIKVHPSHRHHDSIAYNQLWTYIDGFVKHNKSHLLSSSK